MINDRCQKRYLKFVKSAPRRPMSLSETSCQSGRVIANNGNCYKKKPIVRSSRKRTSSTDLHNIGFPSKSSSMKSKYRAWRVNCRNFKVEKKVFQFLKKILSTNRKFSLRWKNPYCIRRKLSQALAKNSTLSSNSWRKRKRATNG